jgi:hypothetical protein
MIEKVQCENRGNEGTSVKVNKFFIKCFYFKNNYFVFIKWECQTTDLPFYDYLSTYTVSCEGYDYIGDPFVLEGSCAV